MKNTKFQRIHYNGMSKADVKFDKLMRKYFDSVCEPDWKAPIASMIHKKNVRAVADAIMYYTGTVATFCSLDCGLPEGRFTAKDIDTLGNYPAEYEDSKYVSVIADGYRMGPCGP